MNTFGRQKFTMIHRGDTYDLVENRASEPAIRCRLCGHISYDPADQRVLHCPNCHMYHRKVS